MKVYKVFLVAKFVDGSKEIYSPYHLLKTWRCGVNYSAPDAPRNKELSQILREIYKMDTAGNEIHGGAFHSLIKKEDAYKLVKILAGNKEYNEDIGEAFIYTNATDVDIVIGECTVPEDSEYVFEGDFQFVETKNQSVSVVKMRSVASSNLILDRILEE